MRRSDKKIHNRKDLELIFHKAQVCRLGLCDEEVPYIVPVHFGYLDGCLYIHSASTGKKIDLLKKNPKVCFEIDIDYRIHDSTIPCDFSTSYQSIIGFGTATIVTNDKEKRHALEILIDHYASGKTYEFSKEKVKRVAIIKITIEHMTGKRSKK